MTKSKIEWTTHSWNPVTGCTKVSPGCLNCYAEKMARRLQAMGQAKYSDGFDVRTHEDTLDFPLKTKKPGTIFVNSMSDLFHESVPLEFIQKVFDVMRRAHWHTFQVLTKRSGRLRELNPTLEWPENVWMGVSVENEDYLYRIDNLRKTDSPVKFISFEPLIGPIPDFDPTGIDWVIVGGESGPGARPMKEEWVINLRDICLSSSVPFFFKQWGGVNKKKNGRELQGEFWDEFPSKINDLMAINQKRTKCLAGT